MLSRVTMRDIRATGPVTAGAFALAAVGVAFLLRQAIAVATGPGLPPFITFYPAVMLVALLGGLWPGLLAAALASGMTLLWILPRPTVAGFRLSDVVGLSLFLLMGVFMSLVADFYRRARQRAAASQKELSIRESEARFSTVFHASPIAMTVTRLKDGTLEDANQRFLDLTGCEQQQVIGRSPAGAGLRTSGLDDILSVVRDGGSVRNHEITLTNPAGGQWTALVTAERIVAAGEPCAWTLYLDISDRIRVLNELRDSEERFRGTLESMLEGCQIIGFDWTYLYLNSVAAGHGGLPREQLLGRKMADVYPGIAETPMFATLRRCMEERVPLRMENEFTLGPGPTAWFDLSFQPVAEGVFILSYDISERKKSEIALRDNQRLLQTVIDLVPHFIFAKDRDSRHLFVNRACAAANLLTPQQMVGLNDLQLAPDHAQAEGFMRVDRRVIDAGTEITLEENLTDRTGKSRILHTTKIPFTLPGSSEKALLGVAVDITELKKAEAQVRRLNTELEARVIERTAELETANKELEAFAYAVSHDLRAPLRALRGFSQALKEDFGSILTGEAGVYLDQISSSSQEMAELIDGILRLSRSTRGGLTPERVDLSAVARRILEGLASSSGGGAVSWSVQPDLVAYADPRLIEVVLTNLLENAWKYSARAVEPAIRFYAEGTEDARTFCVADNGAGFDPRHAARLFKPFQRLHRQEEFPGIGIGLATVQRIVSRHGGIIRGEGAPGRGAVFSFTLPRRETIHEEIP